MTVKPHDRPLVIVVSCHVNGRSNESSTEFGSRVPYWNNSCGCGSFCCRTRYKESGGAVAVLVTVVSDLPFQVTHKEEKEGVCLAH